jgi:hypothetical protein
MTNEKRTILLIGAMIVAALWFRVVAEYAASTSHVINITEAEVISPETLSPPETQAALIETVEFGKICTNADGSPVKCSEFDDDTICIRTRVGAHSGIRVDCKSERPIPADDDSVAREGGAKYRSPY